MVEFIKKTGRVPVVQQVASKQEAQQKIADQAIKEAREYTGEGLRIAKDLVDRYF